MNVRKRSAVALSAIVASTIVVGCAKPEEKVAVATQPDAYSKCVLSLRQNDQVHGGSRGLLLEVAQRGVTRVEPGESRTRMRAATAAIALELGRSDIFNEMVDALDPDDARLILSSGPGSMDAIAALKDLRSLTPGSKHLGSEARDQIRNANSNGMSAARSGVTFSNGG